MGLRLLDTCRSNLIERVLPRTMATRGLHVTLVEYLAACIPHGIRAAKGSIM